MSHKPIHKQNTEELLKALDNPEVEEKSESDLYQDPILKFISQYKLETGTTKVLPRGLYNLFKLSIITHLSKIEFSNALALHIRRDHGYFYLNVTSVQVSDAVYRAVADSKRERTASPKEQRQFKQFVDYFKLSRGGQYVEWYVLFYMYHEWRTATNLGAPFSIRFFKKFLSINFQQKQITADVREWYGINRESIKEYLTDEKRKEIKSWFRQEKEKSEKQIKIPRIKPQT